MVTVEVSGRVVNADAGDPVGNVRVSFGELCCFSPFTIPREWRVPRDSATSGGDGTFTLPLNLPRDWSSVTLKLTGSGYEDRNFIFESNTAGTRAEIRMFPTLVIRPGESIEVRVERIIVGQLQFHNACAFLGVIPCRRVLVDASPGKPVELEIVSHDTSKPMGLAGDIWDEESVPRLMVAPGGVAYVHGAGTGRLTARRYGKGIAANRSSAAKENGSPTRRTRGARSCLP